MAMELRIYEYETCRAHASEGLRLTSDGRLGPEPVNTRVGLATLTSPPKYPKMPHHARVAANANSTNHQLLVDRYA
jgi:hypothetical protein